jgi:hypothetical protein
MFGLPPAVIIPSQQLPPLSFRGFRAGMPVVEALGLIRAARGTLTCKATSDLRLRDCTGILPQSGTSFDVLISSANDSVAVLVLSVRNVRPASPTARWVADLTKSFGQPNRRTAPGGRGSWQWIRAGTMLRVAERRVGSRQEASITITHGPLLDRLATPQNKRPDDEHPADRDVASAASGV